MEERREKVKEITSRQLDAPVALRRLQMRLADYKRQMAEFGFAEQEVVET